MAQQASQGGIRKTTPHAPFPPSAPTGTGPGVNQRIKGMKSPQTGANTKLPKFTKGKGSGL